MPGAGRRVRICRAALPIAARARSSPPAEVPLRAVTARTPRLRTHPGPRGHTHGCLKLPLRRRRDARRSVARGRARPRAGTVARPRAPRAVGVGAVQPGEMESLRWDVLTQPDQHLQGVEREARSTAHRMNPPAPIAGPAPVIRQLTERERRMDQVAAQPRDAGAAGTCPAPVRG